MARQRRKARRYFGAVAPFGELRRQVHRFAALGNVDDRELAALLLRRPRSIARLGALVKSVST